MEDKFTFGNCEICNKFKPLKNRICADCEEKNELPKEFLDLFKGIGKNKK